MTMTEATVENTLRILEEVGLLEDFKAFNEAIDDAKERYGMSESEAITFVSDYWEIPK